jgi:hypothetical protein
MEDMRKRITGQRSADTPVDSDQDWLNLEQIATVEVSSEDPAFPVESVFLPGKGPGWRAAQPGEQHIHIIFDEPVTLRRIQLQFREPERERTQQFTLRWSPAKGGQVLDIVRQQWNFSPAGSTTEHEDYVVALDAVAVLELAIQPDLDRQEAVATLQSWRVA